MLTLYQTITTFNDLENKAFQKYCGKGENAGNHHFLHFPQYFLPFLRHISFFLSLSFCRLQMLSIWTSLNILSFSKELNKAYCFKNSILWTGVILSVLA